MTQVPSAPTDGLPWLPSDACTLSPADQPARVVEFDQLFRAHLVAVRAVTPTRAELTLRGGDGLDEEVSDLVARETTCCSFFRFDVGVTGGRVDLVVEVPPARAGVLAALIDRAQHLLASGRG
jgi:hypothetical protein